jgi:dihydrofolate synthase/folylpolyglutamate synthase
MAELLAALDDPHRRYPVFHVGGTNGKGSTVATLNALLRAQGRRVARYTSPHLVDFAERIVVDDTPVRARAVVEWLDRYDRVIVELGVTFFEATTAMAFDLFRAANVDVALVEVGLGGRLDATNLVHPVAAAVTSIDFDHMEYLGDTLAAIAHEKGGIFKPGCAAIIGEARAEARDVLAQCAFDAGASPVRIVGRDWEVREQRVSSRGTTFTLERPGAPARVLTTPLVGAFQAENASVAFGMLDAAGGDWQRAAHDAETTLAGVRLAGRFQSVPPWLFDVGHNPEGTQSVVENLRATAPPRPLAAIVSVLRDKDWRTMLVTLAAEVDEVILTIAPTAPTSRVWSLDEVVAWCTAAHLRVRRVDDFGDALRRAASVAATIVVTGSFHTVGDAMERLQVDPLAQ